MFTVSSLLHDANSLHVDALVLVCLDHKKFFFKNVFIMYSIYIGIKC